MSATKAVTTGTLPPTMHASCDLHTSVWDLTSEPMPVRQARQVMLEQLAPHITDPGLLEEVAVMISEATTNAAVHAPGPCELRLISHEGFPLIVEIADTGGNLTTIADRLAAGSTPDDLAALLEGGRGLGIIARLSEGRCGVHPTRLYAVPSGGKAVWFAIPEPAP